MMCVEFPEVQCIDVLKVVAIVTSAHLNFSTSGQ